MNLLVKSFESNCAIEKITNIYHSLSLIFKQLSYHDIPVYMKEAGRKKFEKVQTNVSNCTNEITHL